MAATNAYVTIARIPSGGQSGERVAPLSNGSSNSSVFELKGGKYALDLIAQNFGTVTLQRLGPDGSTWLPVTIAISAGIKTADLPPGQYMIALA